MAVRKTEVATEGARGEWVSVVELAAGHRAILVDVVPRLVDLSTIAAVGAGAETYVLRAGEEMGSACASAL